MKNKYKFSNEYKLMKDNKFPNKITNLEGEDINMIFIISAIYVFLKEKSTSKKPIRNTL